MQEPETVSVETVAALNASQVNVVNLMWMTRISQTMARDEVVFESPAEMDMFRTQITLVLASLIVGDASLLVSTLRDMGLAHLADLVRATPEMQATTPRMNLGDIVREAQAEGRRLDPSVLAFFGDFPEA